MQDLRYGENPHQRAAYYAEDGTRRHLLSKVEQLNGKELSFINLYDLNGALLLLREFALPACVIVKHANACGAAAAATIDEAYDKRARVRPALRVRDGLRGEPPRHAEPSPRRSRSSSRT